MDARIAPYSLSNPIPLRNTNPAYGGTDRNFVNGSNLVRKAAQLVNDIENTRDRPSFQELYGSSALNETSFQTFVDKIKAELEKTDKPFTLLNVIGAQNTLLKQAREEDKQIDQTV
tara:strand:+ start:141 stop:488 length:348 start_codon:yes stop_codon:yes gene_type:complete